MQIICVMLVAALAAIAVDVLTADASDIQTEVDTYPVYGRDVVSLREGVITASKRLRSGSHGAANATFALAPQLSYTTRWGGCSLSSVRVKLDIAVTFPEWMSGRGADEETVAAWRRFDRYLKEHEKRHVEIAVDHREQMIAALKAIGTKDDCQAVGREAVAVVADVQQDHDEAQQAFDRAERDRSSLLGR